MNDIIFERVSLNKCPICNEPLSAEIKEVDYKGKQIKICVKHIIMED